VVPGGNGNAGPHLRRDGSGRRGAHARSPRGCGGGRAGKRRLVPGFSVDPCRQDCQQSPGLDSAARKTSSPPPGTARTVRRVPGE